MVSGSLLWLGVGDLFAWDKIKLRHENCCYSSRVLQISAICCGKGRLKVYLFTLKHILNNTFYYCDSQYLQYFLGHFFLAWKCFSVEMMGWDFYSNVPESINLSTILDSQDCHFSPVWKLRLKFKFFKLPYLFPLSVCGLL